MHLLVLVAVAFGSFLSTSLDSLAFLVPAISSGMARTRSIVAGYLAALSLIVAVSLGVALLGADRMPVETGWLGLLPLTMGLAMMVRGFARESAETYPASPEAGSQKPESQEPGSPKPPPAVSGARQTALVTLSMSGDNLGVFIPLFIDGTVTSDLVVIGTLAGAGVGWAWFARYLGTRPVVREWAQVWGPRIMPFILMAVGLFILSDTGLDLE